MREELILRKKKLVETKSKSGDGYEWWEVELWEISEISRQRILKTRRGITERAIRKCKLCDERSKVKPMVVSGSSFSMCSILKRLRRLVGLCRGLLVMKIILNVICCSKWYECGVMCSERCWWRRARVHFNFVADVWFERLEVNDIVSCNNRVVNKKGM